jgi:hypothetical protein
LGIGSASHLSSRAAPSDSARPSNGFPPAWVAVFSQTATAFKFRFPNEQIDVTVHAEVRLEEGRRGDSASMGSELEQGQHIPHSEAFLIYTARLSSDTSSNMMLSASNRAGAAAPKRKNWKAMARGLLKAELKRRDVSYADLAVKLAAVGVTDSERNISNKISRGTFSAVFFLQCMEAIGCTTIHLNTSAVPRPD